MSPIEYPAAYTFPLLICNWIPLMKPVAAFIPAVRNWRSNDLVALYATVRNPETAFETFWLDPVNASINPSILVSAIASILVVKALILTALNAVMFLMSVKILPSSLEMASIVDILTFCISLLQKSTKPSPNDLRLSENSSISDFPRILSTQPPDFGTVLASCVTNVPA